jgi:Flp pilus assembly protein TadB
VSAVVVALLCGAAVLIARAPGRAHVRLGRLVEPARDGPATAADSTEPGASRGIWVAVAVSAVACAVLIGGVPGVLAGIVAAAVGHRVLSRLEPRSVRAARRRTAADLPAAADLLAACLLSGAPMIDAAEAVAGALGGPIAGPLREVAAAIRLGADPADAWRALDSRPELAPIARAIARAMAGGAPLAGALTRLADERRQALRAEASAAARRVGVRAAALLGLCFLPAFVLLGVAPVIASIAATVVLP